MLELDRFEEKAKFFEQQKQKQLENEEAYKESLNVIFSTSHGKYVLKHLLKFCGIFEQDEQLNPAKLVEDRGRRSVYLKMIRPYLDVEIKKEIENL